MAPRCLLTPSHLRQPLAQSSPPHHPAIYSVLPALAILPPQRPPLGWDPLMWHLSSQQQCKDKDRDFSLYMFRECHYCGRGGTSVTERVCVSQKTTLGGSLSRGFQGPSSGWSSYLLTYLSFGHFCLIPYLYSLRLNILNAYL